MDMWTTLHYQKKIQRAFKEQSTNRQHQPAIHIENKTFDKNKETRSYTAVNGTNRHYRESTKIHVLKNTGKKLYNDCLLEIHTRIETAQTTFKKMKQFFINKD